MCFFLNGSLVSKVLDLVSMFVLECSATSLPAGRFALAEEERLFRWEKLVERWIPESAEDCGID